MCTHCAEKVYLRNAAAALEAERKLTRLSHMQHMNSINCTAPSEGIVHEDDVMMAQASGSGAVFLSDVHQQIRPEVEALLRAIFRHLDSADCGLVSSSLLLQCINPTDQTLTPVQGDDDTRGRIALRDLLKRELGDRLWNNLIAGLEDCSTSDISWGEFLLMLIPSEPLTPSIPVSRSSLSRKEVSDLHVFGLLNTSDWGVLPLQLHVQLPGPVHAGNEKDKEEVKRLKAERAFLIARLQDNSRSLERRAEGIRAYFEANILKSQLRENRLSQQNADLKDTVDKLQHRLLELEAIKTENVNTLENKLYASEKSNGELRGLLSDRSSEDVFKSDQLLKDEKAKFSRLEMEHHLLQREAGKREVKNKSLQRDIMKLQASLVTTAEDNQLLKSRLEEHIVREEELTRTLQQVQSVREDLMQKVAACELGQDKEDIDIAEARDKDRDSVYINRIKELEREVEELCKQTTTKSHESKVHEDIVLDSVDSDGGRRSIVGMEGAEAVSRRYSASTARPVPVPVGVPASPAPAPRTDILSAHLTRLLRLADEAISNQ